VRQAAGTGPDVKVIGLSGPERKKGISCYSSFK